MDRIDHPTATEERLFTGGNPGAGIPPTRVTSDWLNDVQEELCAVIEGAGLVLDPEDRTQLTQAILVIVLAQLDTLDVADIDGLQAALDAKAAADHDHAVADVTGLQTALDGKAATEHGHDMADVDGLPVIVAGDAGKLLRVKADLSGHELVTGRGTLFRQYSAGNVTINVNPATGNDSTGDGSGGAPFATIAKAVEVAHQYETAHPASTITIQLSQGTHTVTSNMTLRCNAPRRLLIQGATSSVSMTGIQSCTGASGNWTVVINCADVTGVVAGDLVGFGYGVVGGGGTNPEVLLGCHQVTGVDGINNRITLSVKTRTASVVSGACTATPTVYKTLITNSGNGNTIFQVLDGAYLGFTGLAFYNGTTAGAACVTVGKGGIVETVGTTGAWGCNCPLQLSSGGFGYFAGYVGNCQFGLIAAGASQLETYYPSFNGCDSAVRLMYGASAYVMAPYIAGCDVGIDAVYGPTQAYVGGGIIKWCPTSGISAVSGSHISAFSATVTGCGYGHYANAHGFINANGATSGNSTDFSPAANTPGNEDSYINT
jgi:hypothetical protein